MYLDKSINKYLVLDSEGTTSFLKRYRSEKSRFMVVVDQELHFIGVITNGDIIDWILNDKKGSTNTVLDITNKNCRYLNENSSHGEMIDSLKSFHSIPMLDNKGRLVAVARQKPEISFQIGNFKIGESHKTFIISEIGINHNGCLKTAKNLVAQSVESGADAVKVQVRDLGNLYTKTVLDDSLKAEHGTQYLLNELKKSELANDHLLELSQFCRELGILFFGTPFDLPSVDRLEEIDPPAYKIGSPDFTNLPLLERVSSLGKPMIISTGMSNEHEIHTVLENLNEWGSDFALLHCNSTYPASVVDLNLNYIKKLKTLSNRVVGYSGHERGYLPTLASVAMGAKIIERHLTLDRSHDGPDHSSSLEPKEFEKMVKDIRLIESSMGQEKRVFNQGEQVNRVALGKSLVLARDMSAGEVISRGDLIAKTPARGISPIQIDKFIGKEITKSLQTDQYIQFEDISINGESKSVFDINKNWGIVGRLNDFEDFLEWKPKLIEIHLTWRDLDQYNSHTIASRYSNYDQELVVHAPEYFNDQLIDFATDESSVLDYSIEMLERTVSLARTLGSKFKKVCPQNGPKVVVHPGGHFEFQKETNRSDQYKLLKQNLALVDHAGVELLVENMPPKPWYFGGQWYNTIFMDAQEIKQFSEFSNLGICYDTSHALLYCNSVGMKLNQFTRNLLGKVRHLHVSDGAGTTQEGLQLGDGVMDFEHLFEVLNEIDVGFIPEIWQGHLNNGKGFHTALSKIEKLLLDKMSTRGCSSV